jgi:hypothetical protein
MIFVTVSSLPKMIIHKLSDFHLSKRLKPWIMNIESSQMDLSSKARTSRLVTASLAVAHGKWGRTQRFPHISIAFPAAACNEQFGGSSQFLFELWVTVKYRLRNYTFSTTSA